MSLTINKKTSKKLAGRIKRKARIRSKIRGTAEKPRLNIFKGSKHFNIQFIDDTTGNTILAVNSISKNLRGKYPVNIEGAKKLAELVAKEASKKGIKKVVFDRNGYKFHGVVASFANTVRDKGLEF